VLAWREDGEVGDTVLFGAEQLFSVDDEDGNVLRFSRARIGTLPPSDASVIFAEPERIAAPIEM